MGLVEDEQRPGLRAQAAQALEEPLVGQHDADVGHRGLAQHRGDVAVRQFARQRIEVVELHDPCGRRRIVGGRDVARARHRPSVGSDHDEGLVDRPVVRIREDQDLGALGHETHEAQQPSVRVRGRQREGPLREAEAPRHLGRDPLGVLIGQHRGDPAVDPDATLEGLDERAR